MKKSMTALCLSLIIMIVVAAGCGPKTLTQSDFVGSYSGTSGSMIELHEDGTCIYAENDSTGTGTGTWNYVEGRVTVTVSNLSYDIYAAVDPQATVVPTLVFKADSSKWNDEAFIRKVPAAN